jgi:hypothetical protein
MSGQDAMFIFWRSFVRDPWVTSEGRVSFRPVTYAMRSLDRGYHWCMPPVIVPHYHLDSVYGTTNYIKLPDGDIIAAFGVYRYAPYNAEIADQKVVFEGKRARDDEEQRRLRLPTSFTTIWA